MARPAPAVERAIAILNHLAAHPGERFGLSEIARDLGINKATLHAILNEMTDAGYLVRDEASKTYGLGPALIAVGNAALDAQPAAQVALPEMQSLSDDLGLDCVASAAIGDEIVILESSRAPRPFGIYVQPGQRLPLAPPLGTVFVAWSGSARIERWLSRVGPKVSKAERERYRAAVDAVRRRGYSVGLEGDSAGRLARALRTAPKEGERRPPTVEERVRRISIEEYALLEPGSAPAYRVNHVGAPVFGPDGEVAIALFLIGFQGEVTAEMLDHYAGRLCAAASRVTKAVHGREPDLP